MVIYFRQMNKNFKLNIAKLSLIFVLLIEHTIINLKNYYSIISDHKEIIRVTMGLQGIILMLKGDITTLGNVILLNNIHFK